MTVNNNHYDPYVAQSYRDDAQAAEEDADHLADEGQRLEAARHYEEAADAYEEYQAYTGKDRSDRIEALRTAAEQMRADESDDSGGGMSATGSDGLRSRVESFITTTDVAWSDIGGLEDTKEQISHEIGLGSISGLPDAVQASDRFMLFGPPGTGKTLLASAISNEMDTTFFNVKLGGLLSKWHGESSELISLLFEVARARSPSVLFFDEIDALTQSRSGSGGVSQRVLNALLSELDGLAKDADEFLMVIGSTNRPMDIDDAVIRRFPTRIHVPLPDADAAAEIVRIHTINGDITFDGDPSAFDPDTARGYESVPAAIGQACVRRQFTGSDIEALCQRAISEMIRAENPDLSEQARESLDELNEDSVSIRPLGPDDIHGAFSDITASLSDTSIEAYEAWAEKYGTG
jgi:SpoVK/Ycf46/Vps4 family AAA+-type ATPase